jgi:hypothetical protein
MNSSERVMALLSDHVPLSLLLDLALSDDIIGELAAADVDDCQNWEMAS